MNKPSVLLKVMSIIFIIFGILSIIGSAIIITGGGVAAAFGAGALGLLAIAVGAVGIVGGVVMLVGGVLGNKAKNLKTCFTIGIVILVFQIVGLVLGAVQTMNIGGQFSPLSLVGVVLTILYIVGVKQTENTAA